MWTHLHFQNTFPYITPYVDAARKHMVLRFLHTLKMMCLATSFSTPNLDNVSPTPNALPHTHYTPLKLHETLCWHTHMNSHHHIMKYQEITQSPPHEHEVLSKGLKVSNDSNTTLHTATHFTDGRCPNHVPGLHHWIQVLTGNSYDRLQLQINMKHTTLIIDIRIH